MSGNLLSLEEDAIEVRYALMDMGLALWSAVLVNVPSAQTRWQRMTSPVLGDHVMEITAARRERNEDDRYRGFGVLLSNVDEHGGGDFVRVQYGPSADDVCTWSNADFIALPIAGAGWWYS